MGESEHWGHHGLWERRGHPGHRNRRQWCRSEQPRHQQPHQRAASLPRATALPQVASPERHHSGERPCPGSGPLWGAASPEQPHSGEQPYRQRPGLGSGLIQSGPVGEQTCPEWPCRGHHHGLFEWPRLGSGLVLGVALSGVASSAKRPCPERPRPEQPCPEQPRLWSSLVQSGLVQSGLLGSSLVAVIVVTSSSGLIWGAALSARGLVLGVASSRVALSAERPHPEWPRPERPPWGWPCRGHRRRRLFVRDGPYTQLDFRCLARNKALLDFYFASVSFL